MSIPLLGRMFLALRPLFLQGYARSWLELLNRVLLVIVTAQNAVRQCQLVKHFLALLLCFVPGRFLFDRLLDFALLNMTLHRGYLGQISWMYCVEG